MPISKKTGRWIGGVALSAVDGIVEAYPEIYPPGIYDKGWPVEPLPPADDWIVLGASLGTLLLGHYIKQDLVKAAGEGMTLYSAPMMVHEVMVRAARMAAKPTAVAVAPPRPVYVPPAPAPVPAPKAPAATLGQIY
jgi:hypothetical protein